MIFSELYSAYYNVVARIVNEILKGERDEKKFRAIVNEYAFGESMLSIIPSLKSGKWQIIRPDMTTPIKNPPELPLTLLEKRWLKAVSLDPRIGLFGMSFDWLGDTEPLFTPEDYQVYDQYSDGDLFSDEGYIERFRFVLKAIEDRLPVTLSMINRNGNRVRLNGIPYRLEYSEKDDKFRVILGGDRRATTVNMGRIISVKPYTGDKILDREVKPEPVRELVLTVDDYRNALERVMLHFAHFEKKAERVEGQRYRLRIRYELSDETEMIIRVLSFGPMVHVEAPDDFVERVRERLKRQMELSLNQI